MPEEIVDQVPVTQGEPTLPVVEEPPKLSLREKVAQRFGFLKRLPERSRKIILIAGAIFVILIIFIFVLAAVNSRRRVGEMPASTPIPAGFTPLESEITNPSRYASDAGVLKIEADLKDFETKVSQEKAAEEDLKLPQLDFNVAF